MSSAVIAENYSAAKLKEYICFVEQLGSNIHFHENKWVCSNLRRSPAERSCMFTLYFDRIPALHRETVKSFAAISLIRGKKISTVKSYVMDLIRFFDFWSLDKGTLPLSGCDEFAVADFYHYLEKTEFAEATRIGIWSSLSIFFETMNDIDGARSKNPFSVSPYTDADGNLIRLTCDDFACAAEFRRWKDWSDSDLRKEENADHKQSDNSISLEVLSEEATAVVSIEDEYMEQISADEAAVLVRLLRQGLSSHLTETQRRRLWKYCVEGKPVRLIAKEECAYRNAVWKSIQAAKEKMFEFLVETGCAKPRFRRDR